MTTNIGVIGSRTFTDRLYMFKILDQYLVRFQDIKIISGGAPGADTIAEEYAKLRNIEIIKYLPNYEMYGKTATLIRNGKIAKESDIILAFPNGSKGGTYDIIRKAKNLGKDIIIF